MADHYTPEELAEMVRKMQLVSDLFYRHAQQVGNHAFIEFTGLMNEYINMCRSAAAAGIDYTATTIHGDGAVLPMREHHRRYLDEKLQCIYGRSLEAITGVGDDGPDRPQG